VNFYVPVFIYPAPAAKLTKQIIQLKTTVSESDRYKDEKDKKTRQSRVYRVGQKLAQFLYAYANNFVKR